MKSKGKKARQIEEALVVEIGNCADADRDQWSMGRCYGLAHALAMLGETSTDEELWRVAEDNDLMAVAVPLFGWTPDTKEGEGDG